VRENLVTAKIFYPKVYALIFRQTSDELKKALEMADVDVEVNVWPGK
jgi:hypothetical protein